ncbi:MAG: aldehyde ferredoxin oxidoreductase family protein [Promethearchaeota archaeon]
MLGYNGKIVYIDLDSKKVEIKELNPIDAENFVGGVGLSAKLTYDLLADEDYEILKKNPYASINPLIFATGPLTGSITPSSGRYSVAGISPLTKLWGESTSGGQFPIALRKSGFDAIIITGDSEKPIYLIIDNGTIEFKSAENIWGKGTYETIDAITNELRDEKIRVACIGKGGENLVKYACIINDEGRAAGRCGFGALMGHRKLKAIAIRGTNKIEYDDFEQMKKSVTSARAGIEASFAVQFQSHYGTACYTDMGMVIGDVPAYYFTQSEFIAEKLTGRSLKENFPVLNYYCAGCTIGCGRTTIYEKDGNELEIDGPEYETLASFGPLCGNFEWEPILEANHLCNIYGIDTISAGVSIAFLIYLVENKIAIDNIKKYLSDINLEDIKWGNGDLTVKLVEKISKTEGIGKLLSKGVKIMAEELEVDPELAAHVKGLEMPMHDPRAYNGQALSYMTCCCGASHEKGEFYHIDGNGVNITGIKKADRFDINGREKDVINMQDLANLYDSAVICNKPYVNIPHLTKIFQAATGFKSLGNKRRMLKAGERANSVKRLISCKLGVTRDDDHLTKINTNPIPYGGTAGNKLELDENLRKYYEIRGWDWETGRPTKEKLEELGI